VHTAPVILFEGIHAFHNEIVRNMLDIKIFINTDNDVRLGRKCIKEYNSSNKRYKRKRKNNKISVTSIQLFLT